MSDEPELSIGIDSCCGAIMDTGQDSSTPDGWRKMSVGEVAKPGDAYWHFSYLFWVILAPGDYGCELIGQPVGEKSIFIERLSA